MILNTVRKSEKKEKEGEKNRIPIDIRNKFVTWKSEKVEESETAWNTQQIKSHKNEKDFHQEPGKSWTCLQTQLLRWEFIVCSQQESWDQDIGNKRHTWYVQIWWIKIITWCNGFIRCILHTPILSRKIHSFIEKFIHICMYGYI